MRFFRRRADRDFHDEIEAHIRLETDRLINQGIPPAEAEAAARRAFGSVAMAREKFYESQRPQWWDHLRQDVRYGLRSLRKTPGFTAVAALTIALGVGANTAVFSLVDAVLIQTLPLQDPTRLVFPEAAGTAGPSGAPPYPCLTRLRAETSSFSGLAAFSNHDELRLEIDGRPEQVKGQIVSGNYFELLGVKPALGRLLQPPDENLNPPVAVISSQYWRRRFGGDPAVIGKTFVHSQRTFIIAGVTPPDFRDLQPGSRADVTIPITIARQLLADSGAWGFYAVARLKPDVSVEQAQAESDAVFQSFMSGHSYPADLITKHFHHLELRPAAHGLDSLRKRFSEPLYLLMGIVGLVLLMAIANIANLLLARGISRQREFAIRLATGAGCLRLVKQLLTETLLLFALGAVPGVIFARWGVNVIEGLFASGRRAITLDVNFNWRVLAFTILVTLAAGLLSGMLPAWRAFRASPDQAMKEGLSRASGSHSSAVMTRSLVVLQVALSLVLLVGAVSLVQSLTNLRNVNTGFRNEQVLTMSVELPDGYVQAGKPGEVWSRTLDAVRSIHGVRAAALCVMTPLSGRDRGAPVQVRGYEPSTWQDSAIRVNQVSEGYFETLGIPLVRGRLLARSDAEGMPSVVVINESAARKYFAGRDPIGESLVFGKGKTESVYRIVGIAGDTKHRTLREPIPPFAFIPIRQPREAERRVTLVVTSMAAGGEMALLQPVRLAVAGIDPRLMISEVITMQGQINSTLLAERLLAGLSGAFGALALILASVGLYGVLSYRIGQQRQSIGIRMALGASPSSVALAVVRESGTMVALGLAAGLPFAVLAARAAGSMLWEVKSSDPVIYLAAIALLSLVGLGSAYLPARRASATEPAEALRQS